MNLFSKQTFIKLVKVVVITLILLFLFQLFFLETYSLRSSQMSMTLIPGDRVLVNKMSYGPRIPKSVFGVELPYYRCFESPIQVRDVVLFNSPYPFNKVLSTRDLLVSRCVAQPGDTVVWNGEDYIINNQYFNTNLNAINDYKLAVKDVDQIQARATKNAIQVEWGKAINDSIIFKVSKAEAWILADGQESLFRPITVNLTNPIYLIVPKKGSKLKLTKNNIDLYQQALLYENPSISIQDDKIYIDKEPLETYTFQEDYYWFLSDNAVNSIDSKSLGFIPLSAVVGKVTLVLYNTESSSRFLETVN